MPRRKKPITKNPYSFYSETYWQSGDYNQRLYIALYNIVEQLAITRFKWVNLPETCDERYLEWVLFNEGAATIAAPKRTPHIFYSTKAVQVGRPNVYDNPIKWRSIGANGWKFDVTPLNGVMIYDNTTRLPMLDLINLYVRELVDIARTKQLNRMHVKTPYLITVPQDLQLTAVNTVKQILGGEPAILGTEYMREIDIQAIKTDVQFLGMELTQEELNTWNKIYAALGISNLTFKAERQIEDEVQAVQEPTDLMALSPLKTRRDAANVLNKRFGLDIHVVWRQDNESENYNLQNNLYQQLTLDGDV